MASDCGDFGGEKKTDDSTYYLFLKKSVASTIPFYFNRNIN